MQIDWVITTCLTALAGLAVFGWISAATIAESVTLGIEAAPDAKFIEAQP